MDLALESTPAARLVECIIMCLAEQQREAHRLVVAQGPDRGVERHRGVAASAAILAGRDAADAADMDRAAVPERITEMDADMAGKPGQGSVLRRVAQQRHIVFGPFDV